MSTPPSGTIIAQKFLLLDIIGQGAMGSVYRAEQLSLHRTVAVKIINPELARDPRISARFHQEARAASRINHPNTIAVIDFGETPEGVLYLVMEFVQGRTLAQLLHQEHPVPPRRVVKILDQVLAGLQEAHTLGIVHRDLKPENILLQQLRSGGDLVKVCDFGIAKLLEPDAVQARATSNMLWGTAEFMAPEQIAGQEVDARADLYSIGAILYEMLAGEPPFTGGAPVEILARHLREAPVPPSKRKAGLSIPLELEAVTLRALAKAPGDRYQSAGELRSALEQCSLVAPAPSAACPACDQVLPEEAAFCPYCGLRIGARPQRTTVEFRTTRPAQVKFPLPLVGRDAEIQALEALLAPRGGARSAVIAAQAGAGKTRLVEELTSRADKRGVRSVRIEADSSGAAEPWRPIRAAVAARLGVPVRVGLVELKQRARDAGLSDGDVQPGLVELFRLAPADSELDPTVRRRECEAAALRALRGGSESPPLLLVFEDVEKIDRPSVALLERLVEAPGDAPLTVIATTAIEGPGPGRWRASQVLTLPPLQPDVVADLVGGVLGETRVRGFTSLVLEGCLPLHLEQALRLALEGGAVEDRALPDLIAARIDALPPDARRALQALAVAGGSATPEVVRRLVRPDDEAEAAIAVLVHRGIAATVEETTAIRHPFFASVAYSTIPADVRRELHARLFELLGAHGASAATLAHHGYAAGGGEPVIALLQRSGEEALALFDHQAAAHHWQRSLELARNAFFRGASGDELRLSRLGVRLAEALLWAGDHTLVEAVLREALEHARQDQGVRAVVLRGMAHLAEARSQPQQADEILRGATAHAQWSNDPALQADLYLESGLSFERRGDVATAIERLGEGLTVCTGGAGIDATNGPQSLWRLLLALGELHLRRGEPGQGFALRFANGALKQAQRVGSRLGQARAHDVLAQIHRAAKREAEVAQHQARAVELMREAGDRRSTAKLLLDLGSHDLATGSPDRARRSFEEARELARAVEWSDGVQRSTNALHAKS